MNCYHFLIVTFLIILFIGLIAITAMWQLPAIVVLILLKYILD